MVQDQLVDYISSQLKLNVSRDAIKAALTGAGWNPQDVDDTFKKVDGASTASPAASPSVSSVSAVKPVGGSSASSGVQPQMIKMSDLVSGSPKSDTIKPAAKSDAFGSFVASSSAMKASESKPSSSSSPSFSASRPVSRPSGKSAVIAESIEAVIVVALAIFAGYLYFNSQSLLSQIAQLKATSGTDASTASTLNSQIDALNASTTALGSQVTSLTAAQQELALELSFYVATPGATATTTTATIGGTLSVAGGRYWVTMQDGAKVMIINAANEAFNSQLKANIGQSVQIAGTYVPGSNQFTMTQLVSPVAATPAASAASTTASDTSSGVAAPMIPATTTTTTTAAN